MTEKKVQRLPDNTFIDPKELKVGDEFVHEKNVWKVVALKDGGVVCDPDHTKFFFPS